MKKKITKIFVLLAMVGLMGCLNPLLTRATALDVTIIGEASTLAELQNFIAIAKEGDVIGIKAEIDVPANTTIGDATKQVTILRETGSAFIYVEYGSDNVIFQNVILDGWDKDSNFQLVDVAGTAEFKNVTFQDCYNGAVIVEEFISTFNNCTFLNNVATYSTNGAHIQIQNGSCIINDSLLKGGTASSKGGAIIVGSTSSTCSINSSIITENQANEGGGIYANGSVTIQDTLIYNNISTGNGSDVYISEYGSFVVNNSIEELKVLYEPESLSYEGLFDELTDTIIDTPCTVSGANGLVFKYSEIVAPTPTPDPEPTPEPTPQVGSGSSSESNTTNNTYNQTYNPTINNTVAVPEKKETKSTEPVQATATVSDGKEKKTYETTTSDDGTESLEIKEGENTITININVGTAETNGTNKVADETTTSSNTVIQQNEPLAAGSSPATTEKIYIQKSTNWVDMVELGLLGSMMVYLFRDKLKVKIQSLKRRKE